MGKIPSRPEKNPLVIIRFDESLPLPDGKISKGFFPATILGNI